MPASKMQAVGATYRPYVTAFDSAALQKAEDVAEEPQISLKQCSPDSATNAAKKDQPAVRARDEASSKSQVLAPEFMPSGHKSLSGIAVRAFCLGTTFGVSLLFTLVLVARQATSWRPPFFLMVLSLFHFFEFYMTALYNPACAEVGAFLLSQNGMAYNMANAAALTESVLVSAILPETWWPFKFADMRFLILGMVFIAIGQTVRSLAMAQAATNFNHTVQTRKNQGHQLVQTGVYRYLRHPSYFGFFFWGIGTQVAIGNLVCSIAYTVILWIFFNTRIRKEEDYLVAFFGDQYIKYRAKTKSGIPFVP